MSEQNEDSFQEYWNRYKTIMGPDMRDCKPQQSTLWMKGDIKDEFARVGKITNMSFAFNPVKLNKAVNRASIVLNEYKSNLEKMYRKRVLNTLALICGIILFMWIWSN